MLNILSTLLSDIMAKTIVFELNYMYSFIFCDIVSALLKVLLIFFYLWFRLNSTVIHGIFTKLIFVKKREF